MDNRKFEEVLRDFSSKFIATIGSEAPEQYKVFGGTKQGWPFNDAFEQFNKDWNLPYQYYMAKLDCTSPLDLLTKLAGKLRVFQQERECFWRVAVLRTPTIGHLVDFIDANIQRRKFHCKRSGNFIPLRNEALFQAFREHRFSLAAYWGGQQQLQEDSGYGDSRPQSSVGGTSIDESALASSSPSEPESRASPQVLEEEQPRQHEQSNSGGAEEKQRKAAAFAAEVLEVCKLMAALAINEEDPAVRMLCESVAALSINDE